ncbi:ABC transporter permease [Nocardia salmonicida]|uniref:ABC transporter permease n=1 Tax=Nocardia salmonicida TaxID=53431 RepID=UPI0007A430C2|nr:ABC transporter permease [Nocardia salmonicida]
MMWLILRRIGAAVGMIFVVSILAFLILSIGNDDLARNILGEAATAQSVEGLTRELGLDKPLLAQFLPWLGDLVRGDLGTSYLTREPVIDVVGDRLPVTFSLMALTIVVVAFASTGLAILAATRRGPVDRAIQAGSIVAHAIPNYLVAMLLASWLAVSLRLFPAAGFVPITESPYAWGASLALPVVSLSLAGVAAAAQQARGALVDVLATDYIRTLRSRGISRRSLLWRHAMRNASPAWLTTLSLQLIGLIGGSFMIEKVFGMEGLGSIAVNSTLSGDRPVLMGIVILTTVFVATVNLLVDLALAWAIPKARVS